MSGTVGRFAPSPTGPLHVGSLVAAVGSWLFAKSAGGRWLVRMEDLDRARAVSGADEEILRTLDRYGLVPDGEVVVQSARTALYEEALASLTASGHTFACACSRTELARAASAPAATDERDAAVYPGTCRGGLPAGRPARAIRFRVPEGSVAFDDLVLGHVEEETSRAVGDFVLKRADGYFAYQLAVVVDDAAQGVTQIVRGADLLSSTGRQILLQRALGFPTPAYAHLPLVLGPDGSKLGKRDGTLPLATLDEARVRDTLRTALLMLGQRTEGNTPEALLANAAHDFDPARIPRAKVQVTAL